MRVAFRIDASLQIGTGHGMRCLTLADSLRERGAQCSFICRPHTGHLLDMIAQRGYQTLALPALNEGASPNGNGTAHAHWLGTDWANDAAETRQLLEDRVCTEPLDWLVVDHYALDYQWERALRPHALRIMAIDDLADRRHECELMLDPNLGRAAQDYTNWIGPNTVTLIGPQYALLRPEFGLLRPESLVRREAKQKLQRLLITMGGVDIDNATGQVLNALKSLPFPSDLQITVVMGPHAPWLAQVREQAAHLPWQTQILVGVSNMARLMTDSDFAIGAAGGTALEACCLGLPSLVLALARNQVAVANSLKNAGAAIVLETNREITGIVNPALLAQLSADNLARLSHAAGTVTDGKGRDRTADRMVQFIHE